MRQLCLTCVGVYQCVVCTCSLQDACSGAPTNHSLLSEALWRRVVAINGAVYEHNVSFERRFNRMLGLAPSGDGSGERSGAKRRQRPQRPQYAQSFRNAYLSEFIDCFSEELEALRQKETLDSRSMRILTASFAAGAGRFSPVDKRLCGGGAFDHAGD